MAATTDCHIGILSRLIILLLGHCERFHQYISEVLEGSTIESRQDVLKVAFHFNFNDHSVSCAWS